MQFVAPYPRVTALAAVLIMASIGPLASAQGYPAKPVRIIVSTGAGGATDTVTRTLGQRLGAAWGQQVLVDNRPGGGGNIGVGVAAQAPADGYTLLMAAPAFTVNVSLYKKLAYDPIRDFSPISLVATGANVLVVHPSVPARSLKDLIALAKAKPGQLSYSSPGTGSSPHLSGELFKTMARIDIVHIPYKSAAISASDLMGGHVDLAFGSLTSVVPHLKANKLRALAITSAKRSTLLPELPTFDESGLRGYEVTGWYGVVAPTGTPKEVIDRLNADITTALTVPEIRKVLGSLGFETAEKNTPEGFAAFLRSDVSKWAKVVKASGARAD